MSISLVRSRYKAILLLAVTIAASFAAGMVFANRVPIRGVQSIAGNRVVVPNSEVAIVRAIWVINPTASTVVAVDLFIFPFSRVWRIKLFEFFIQISCLDETVTPPREFICATGRFRRILPTHWIGIRLVRVPIAPAVNPELTEIHDLSVIITDLNPVPQRPPGVFIGPDLPETGKLTVPQGGTLQFDVMAAGDAGLKAGTEVNLSFTPDTLPVGCTGDVGKVALADDPETGVPMASTRAIIACANNTEIGETDVSLKGTVPGTEITDEAMIELEVVPAPPPPAPTPP